MNRTWFVLGLLVVAAAMPSTAAAGPISDPIIGVRGGKFGSPPIDSGALTPFGACPDELDLKASFTCIPFQITQTFDDGISSIVVQIDKVGDEDASLVFKRDPRSQFFLNDLGNGLIQLAARPDFPPIVGTIIDNHPIVGDILDFLLPPVLQCPNETGRGTHACGAGDDLLLYISAIPVSNQPGSAVAFAAAMQSVNGTARTGARHVALDWHWRRRARQRTSSSKSVGRAPQRTAPCETSGLLVSERAGLPAPAS